MSDNLKGIIERTSQDIEQETIELFAQVKPLLDNGYSINQSIKKVKNMTTVNTNLGWYQRLKEYILEQGYPEDVNKTIGRPRKNKVKP